MKLRFVFRHSVQIIFGSGLTYLFLIQDYTTAPTPFFAWTGWLDPLTGPATLIQNHWPWLAVISVVALLLAVFAGRFFCGWLCPVGTALDLVEVAKGLIHWSNRHPGGKVKDYLNILRWIILGGVLGLILTNRLIALIMNPLALWPRDVFRLALRMIPWSLLILILMGLITFPRFWCRFLCPTGSILNFANHFNFKKYIINKECKHCKTCVRKCPMQNITEELKFGYDCLSCGICKRNCPVHCITRSKFPASNINEGRRDFLITAGVGLGTLAITGISNRLPVRPVTMNEKGWPRLLRPPGALHETALAETCNRCGQCLQICPTHVLVPAGLEANISGLWTPRFIPRKGRCMFCMACGQVCPTKALAPVPVETVRLGQARINHAQCLAWAKATKCLLCVEACPNRAIQIDAQTRPVIDLAKCIGCGSCEAHCPVSGSAVILTNVGETRRNR